MFESPLVHIDDVVLCVIVVIINLSEVELLVGPVVIGCSDK
jgi:hypothetical protein